MDRSEPVTANPILVEVTRNGFVECRHRGCAVVVDATGKVHWHWGDPDQLIIARSALKPIYAVPLVATGAAEAMGCAAVELALACSSHLGGRFHTDPIRRWLNRIG
jgi:L-asparaginase II